MKYMKQRRTLIGSLGSFGAALALTLAGGPMLRAQAPATQTEGQVAAPAAGHEAPEAKGEVRESNPHEGTEHGEEAHHEAITLFGHPLGTVAKFGVQVFNFAIFAGVLVFLLKGALASAFRARAKELEEKLSQAERDRAEAAAQIQELDARMAGLQQELAGIMAKAEADAETEKARILESAKQEAAQILAQTQAEITFQQRQAEEELRALVAELTVEAATRRLETRLTGEAAAQVLDRSIDQVGGAK